MAGAPKGNDNAAKGKVIKSLIAKRLAERELLVPIVDKMLDKAAEGDLTAANMIFDRIDGKPQQSVELSDDREPPTIVFRMPEGYKPEE
jgi:hypothetical protein